MPWCPECKTEYVEGIKCCSDCNCELIEELDESSEQSVIFGEKEFLEELNAFIEYNKLPRGRISPIIDSDNSYELYINEDDIEITKKVIRIFLQEKSFTELEEKEKTEEKNAFGTSLRPYQNKTERAAEVKSSAYTLTIVGIIGIILVILLEFNLLPISLSVFTKHMMSSVMGALFLIFTVMGFHSFSSLKKINEQGHQESNLMKEMKRWSENNLNKESIDAAVFTLDEEFQSEIKYFMRSEEIKKQICNQFLNLEEGFLDKFIEEEYIELYKEEEESNY